MQIYINKNGQQLGAFEENVVLQMLQSGQLSHDDLGIRQGQQQWQSLGAMFPSTKSAWNPSNVQTNQPQFQPINPQPLSQKSGSSKGILFGLIGCGGLLLVGIIGVAAFVILKSKPSDVVYNSNTNSSTNKISAPTPVPDPYKEDSERRTKFESHEADFVKLPAKTQLTKQPYIKGKVAFYNKDVNFGEKDPLWLLDNNFASNTSFDEKVKDIKAKTPEEVETVVLRTCNQFKAGTYVVSGRNIPGYNWSCQVTIIDRSISAVIFRKPFSGKLEREVKVKLNASEVSAYIPYSEIADFLGKLPRK